MKRIIYYMVIAALLISCGGAPDKTEELNKLKAEREKLDVQILQLENEINPGGEKQNVKATAVTVINAVDTVFNHYIEVQGTVDADQNIAVSPQMPGVVTAVHVKEGSQVKKGQTLAELDSRVLRQSLEEVNTQLALANNLYEKQSSLWDKKIGSEVQYLQAKTNKESLEQRLGTIREQMKQAKIISPIAGTVESVPLRVGEMATPGSPASTIRVINMSTAKITANVSEAYASRIKDGNAAIVSLPDLNKEFETTLNFTGRYIDPTNRTFKIESKVSPGDVVLRANMIAYIKIKDYSNPKAISVPVNLVQNDQKGKFLYVAKQDGKNWIAEKRMVKTGKDYNGVIEVMDGISAGEKIITSGFQNLNPGEKIVF